MTTGGYWAEQSISYEDDTRRVHEVQVKGVNTGGTITDRTYGYDPAGNLLSVGDNPEAGAADTQCFGYDPLRRLTSAWTPKAGVTCSTPPSQANLGGPAPYWYDWTIDRLGNRTRQVQHTTTGDLTRDYQVPAAGQDVVRPHAVTAMTTTAPGQSTGTTVSYGYDNAGNTTSRPGATGGQVLTWDAEGHLANVVEGTSTTTNLYDASGNRLLRRDAGGTTLYLPGQEIRRTVTGGTATVTATRYYTFNGGTIASRTTSAIQDLTWLFGDHQGTQQLAVNASTQQVTARRQTPYGEPRGGNPAWPNPKGFVGGDNDPTGLTHLGAREYDPVLGRFISVDPIHDLTDPQQWNGYSYADNNPTTRSDATGLRPDDLYYGPTAATNIEKNAVAYIDDGPVKITPTGRGTADVGGVRVTNDQIKDFNRFRNHVNEAYYKYRSTWGRKWDALDDDTQLLYVMTAACEAKSDNDGSVCSAAYLHALTQELGSRAMYNKGCRGECLTKYRATVAATELTTAMALAAMAQAGANRAAASAGGVAYADIGAMGGGAKIGCVGNSFTADTQVLMADGTTKPIHDVHIGDKVLATDPNTGKTVARKVTDLHLNTDSDLLDLAIEAPTGHTATVHTTAQHPFWSPSRHQWVNAADLRPGDTLAAPIPNALLTIHDVRRFAGRQQMYNLTIADIHTYYVMAGNTPVLVHNEGGVPVPPFVDGQDFEWSIQTPKGNVGILAETSVTGKRVTLSNVVVYGDSPELTRGSLGPSTVLRALRGKIAPAAASQGFEELTISGIRLTGPVGHRPDFTLDLKKYAGGGGC